VTVRKLRKNPETKNELGIELASGWDIINVAQALALPDKVIQKINKNGWSSFCANTDLLYKHTNTLDRFIGRIFYWFFIITGLAGAFLVLLNSFGLFD